MPGSPKPELLLPAGNMEKLRTAFLYGADAAYLGGPFLGLRARAGNFSYEEMAEAVALARRLGKKVYVTANVFAHAPDLEGAAGFFRRMQEIGPDGLLITDPGLFRLSREHAPAVPVHISTQANTTNREAARFWRDLGVQRIVAARELGGPEIGELTGIEGLEVEVFVHGAMCMAYSGRCLLSAALAARSANQGHCAHPCRWEYALLEREHPGEPWEIREGERGAFVLASRDLCLLPRLDALLRTGVHSLKVEGRMKSVHYVATVCKVYRQAIDRWAEDPDRYRPDASWQTELDAVSDRAYCTGFFDGPYDHPPAPAGSPAPPRPLRFCARVLEWLPDEGLLRVEQRNRFAAGDTLEILMPEGANCILEVPRILGTDRREIPACPHPRQEAFLPCSLAVPPGALIRRKESDPCAIS